MGEASLWSVVESVCQCGHMVDPCSRRAPYAKGTTKPLLERPGHSY